ncbi:quinate utilization oxidoreductase QutH [Xylogone sp. PMI_703]|nr:quinate utilization oxidoreductase QutH [Xylogone sp. PMI_703]
MASTSHPDPIPIAIIGSGLIGPRHAQSVKKNPLTKLVALVDPAPYGQKAAEALSTSYYTSISSLINSPHKPVAAIVCTPNHTHVTLSKELIDAGIHVLVEKPVSTDIASGLSLIRRARTNNIHLLVGHHRRFNPYIIQTKKLIESNILGRIIAINGLWTLYKPDSYYLPPTEWRQSSTAGVTRGYEADEGAALIFRFESGAVGTFLVCDAAPSPFNFEAGTGENPTIPKVGKDFYRIFGTDGSLSVPDMAVYSYRESTEKNWTQKLGMEIKDVNEDIVPFDEQVENFAEVIRGAKEPVCDGMEGLRALILCEAVKRAMEVGGVIHVEELEREFNLS